MDVDVRYQKLKEAMDFRIDQQSQEGLVYFLKEAKEIFGTLPNWVQEEGAELCGQDMKIVKALIMRIPSLHGEDVAKIIKVCVGDRCKRRGSVKVLEKIQETLHLEVNQLSADKSLFLKTQKCFGHCRDGINVQIDGELHHHVTESSVIDLLKHKLK